MTRLARTEYYYDEFKGAGANGLQACPNIVYAGHDLASDPYVPGAYNPVTEYRGNVTTIKRFADPIGLNPATAEVETRRYDVAGNLVKTNSSCCEQTTITLNESTQYTWPTSVTRGSVSNASHQNTTGATYDFNTGLVKTSRQTLTGGFRRFSTRPPTCVQPGNMRQPGLTTTTSMTTPA
jgi:hypothetical protein